MFQQKSNGMFFVLLACILVVYVIVAVSVSSHAPAKVTISETVKPQVVEAQTTRNRTTHETVCVMETYDLSTKTLTEETVPIVADYIGLTRSELIHTLREKTDNLSLQEQLAGISSYHLVSFQTDRIVIRKTFDSTQTGVSYLLKNDNGFVTVYYRDGETVYEYTEIAVDSLPAKLQVQLLNGIEIEKEEALYDFLESYSS